MTLPVWKVGPITYLGHWKLEKIGARVTPEPSSLYGTNVVATIELSCSYAEFNAKPPQLNEILDRIMRGLTMEDKDASKPK